MPAHRLAPLTISPGSLMDLYIGKNIVEHFSTAGGLWVVQLCRNSMVIWRTCLMSARADLAWSRASAERSRT